MVTNLKLIRIAFEICAIFILVQIDIECSYYVVGYTGGMRWMVGALLAGTLIGTAYDIGSAIIATRIK